MHGVAIRRQPAWDRIGTNRGISDCGAWNSDHEKAAQHGLFG